MKNNRTFLEKLLDGAEVEWKPLWSITTWDKKFNAVEKEKQPKVIKYHYYLASELKPLIVDGGDVKLLTTNESDIWTTEELVQNNISEGEIIAIPWGGNPIVQYYKGKFVTADNRIATSNNTKILDNKFLYYFLLSKLDVISSFYRGSGIKHPSMYHVLEMLIPIPPLSVQTEIVKILDSLTALTSELTSELILRRKQYKYYREKLLSEEELGKVGFEWRALKDILIRTKGTKITAAEMKVLHKENAPLKIFAGGKTFALVNYSDIPEKDINKNPSIIVKSRGIIEFEYYDKPFSHKNEMWSYYSNDKNINIKYIYYVLKNREPYFQSLGSKMQMPQIATPDTDKYLVPIPPPYIQTEIVKILDKFANLTNSISEGLPLAIEQSQKRYEYYRELLLSF